MSKKLCISVDVGGSQTKIIYQFLGEAPQYLFMSPGIEQISKSDLELYNARQGWIGAPSVEQQAWVEWKDNIFVVGDFVSEFAPVDRIFERKYENALYKLLAAVGVILSKHEVPSKGRGSKVDLSIGLLLPCNEYSDRARFEEQFKIMLSKLNFRGQSWKVNLSNFQCMPEGSGLVGIRCASVGLEWLKGNKVAVLMFGHRNVTAIYFEGGVMKYNDSPLLGFSVFLDDVCSRVSGLERDKLASAIFKGIEEYRLVRHLQQNFYSARPKWENLNSIKALATARDEELRASEHKDLVEAIELAIPRYWMKIRKWLDKVIPTMPTQVLLGGGAALFWEPELEIYFNCAKNSVGRDGVGNSSTRLKASDACSARTAALSFNIERSRSACRVQDVKYSPRTGGSFGEYGTLVWFEDIKEQIEKTFNLHGVDRNNQSIRLIDCFGMFNHIKGIEKENAHTSKTA